MLWVARVLLVLALPGPIAASQEAAEGVRHVLADGGLRLRAGPGTQAAAVAVIPPGAEVRVTGEAASQWVPVSYRGARGHAFSDDLIHYRPPTGHSPESYTRQPERAGVDVEITTTEHDGSGDFRPGTAD